MNNKRQTIWLVSMLSLMVILSAYYLFTEEVPTTDNVNGIQQQALTDAGEVLESNPDGYTVEVEQTGEGIPTAGTNQVLGEAAQGEVMTGPEQEATSVSPEDKEVLKGMTNMEGIQMLDQTQRERMEAVSKRAEELNAIIGDSKVDPEVASQAVEDLGRLQDTDERITSLQEKLLQDYENAVVKEEESNFKVIVLSEKLEKKQAVGIIDMATKELNITPDQVTVQYVK